MLLRQKPICNNDYIAVKDSNVNIYIQKIGFMPKYYYNGVYYYKRNSILESITNIYNELNNRKEVSKFGNL